MPTTSKEGHKKPKSTGKLVVKFPCFKAKVHSQQIDDGQEDDEQPNLTIDEDQEEDQQSAAAAAAAAAQAINMNALLELSLAARLVEEHKQMFNAQLVKPKRARKN